MNRKQKKELRKHQTTRQLMGIEQLTEHGIRTARGELIFYLIKPDNLAILRHLGEKSGVALRIYNRQVTPTEEKAILHNATNKNRMERSNTNNMQQSVTAEAKLQDVVTLINSMNRNQEPLWSRSCGVRIRRRKPKRIWKRQWPSGSSRGSLSTSPS